MKSSFEKPCTKCKEWKVLDDFRYKKDRGGHVSSCIKCEKEYKQANKKPRSEYYQANKKKINEYSKEYRKNNKEKVAEIKRKYNQTNKEEKAEYGRKYREENKEKLAERQKVRYQVNKERILEYRRVNKERIAERQKEYYKTEIGREASYRGRLKRRAYKHKVSFTPHQRKGILDRDNWSCNSCGIKVHDESKGDWNTFDKAHIDHIVPISKGGNSEPKNLRVLCRACNLSKSDKMDEQMQLTI